MSKVEELIKQTKEEIKENKGYVTCIEFETGLKLHVLNCSVSNTTGRKWSIGQ